MALIIIRKKPSPVESSGFSWDRWYAKNKTRLAEKRAKRYREDKDYREKALKRGRNQRKKKTPTVDASSIIFTVSFGEMAKQLGITVWVLREWRRKDYFPEPHHRDGRLWFKPEHKTLLHMLLVFFEAHGVRMVESKRQKLHDVVALIYSNW